MAVVGAATPAVAAAVNAAAAATGVAAVVVSVEITGATEMRGEIEATGATTGPVEATGVTGRGDPADVVVAVDVAEDAGDVAVRLGSRQARVSRQTCLIRTRVCPNNEKSPPLLLVTPSSYKSPQHVSDHVI